MEENFLRGFLRLHSGTEIPPIFLLWSGYGALSCVAGRRLFVQHGLNPVYPNMNIALIGESGSRKSSGAKAARRLISAMTPSPNIISQSVTIPSLIVALTIFDNRGEDLMATNNTGFLFADELASFFRKDELEKGLLSMLTTIIDCHKFDYKTIQRGTEVLEKPCFGMLGCSTPSGIRSAFPSGTIGGGLTSRILFVYSDMRKPPVAWPEHSVELLALEESLIRRLSRIYTLEGQMKVTPDAKALFAVEYNKFYGDPVKGVKGNYLYEDPITAGYAQRRADHVLKLSMLNSLNEGDSLTVEEDHMKKAVERIGLIEKFTPFILRLLSSSESGNELEMVLGIIRGAKRIYSKDLISKVSHRIERRNFMAYVETLTLMGKIRCGGDSEGSFYEYTGKD